MLWIWVILPIRASPSLQVSVLWSDCWNVFSIHAQFLFHKRSEKCQEFVVGYTNSTSPYTQHTQSQILCLWIGFVNSGFENIFPSFLNLRRKIYFIYLLLTDRKRENVFVCVFKQQFPNITIKRKVKDSHFFFFFFFN